MTRPWSRTPTVDSDWVIHVYRPKPPQEQQDHEQSSPFTKNASNNHYQYHPKKQRYVKESYYIQSDILEFLPKERRPLFDHIFSDCVEEMGDNESRLIIKDYEAAEGFPIFLDLLYARNEEAERLVLLLDDNENDNDDDHEVDGKNKKKKTMISKKKNSKGTTTHDGTTATQRRRLVHRFAEYFSAKELRAYIAAFRTMPKEQQQQQQQQQSPRGKPPKPPALTLSSSSFTNDDNMKASRSSPPRRLLQGGRQKQPQVIDERREDSNHEGRGGDDRRPSRRDPEENESNYQSFDTDYDRYDYHQEEEDEEVAVPTRRNAAPDPEVSKRLQGRRTDAPVGLFESLVEKGSGEERPMFLPFKDDAKQVTTTKTATTTRTNTTTKYNNNKSRKDPSVTSWSSNIESSAASIGSWIASTFYTTKNQEARDNTKMNQIVRLLPTSEQTDGSTLEPQRLLWALQERQKTTQVSNKEDSETTSCLIALCIDQNKATMKRKLFYQLTSKEFIPYIDQQAATRILTCEEERGFWKDKNNFSSIQTRCTRSLLADFKGFRENFTSDKDCWNTLRVLPSSVLALLLVHTSSEGSLFDDLSFVGCLSDL